MRIYDAYVQHPSEGEETSLLSCHVMSYVHHPFEGEETSLLFRHIGLLQGVESTLFGSLRCRE